MKRTVYLFAFITCFILSTGIMFKMMHWPGANILIMSGFLLLNLATMPMYFYNKYKTAV